MRQVWDILGKQNGLVTANNGVGERRRRRRRRRIRKSRRSNKKLLGGTEKLGAH
jgi:hypothetical protein